MKSLLCLILALPLVLSSGSAAAAAHSPAPPKPPKESRVGAGLKESLAHSPAPPKPPTDLTSQNRALKQENSQLMRQIEQAVGGTCEDTPGWTDGYNGCDGYARNSAGVDQGWCYEYGYNDYGNGKGSARDNCCICGGGSTAPVYACVDAPGWYDGWNGCDAYEKFSPGGAGTGWCATYGNTNYGGNGKAKDKCCWCGGGSTDCSRGNEYKQGGTWKSMPDHWNCRANGNGDCRTRVPGSQIHTYFDCRVATESRVGAGLKETVAHSPAPPKPPTDLTAQNKALKQENSQLMRQIEEAVGGGCEDTPDWTDGYNGCGAYANTPGWCSDYGWNNYGSGSARENCCACGGGSTGRPSTCVNTPNWFDGWNGCDNYEKNSDGPGTGWCQSYGNTDYGGNGKANDHCCACGGGTLDCKRCNQYRLGGTWRPVPSHWHRGVIGLGECVATIDFQTIYDCKGSADPEPSYVESRVGAGLKGNVEKSLAFSSVNSFKEGAMLVLALVGLVSSLLFVRQCIFSKPKYDQVADAQAQDV